MKAKELAEQLLKYPDFEVEIDIDTAATLSSYLYLVTYKINGIDDIGHSSKVIILGVEEDADE